MIIEGMAVNQRFQALIETSRLIGGRGFIAGGCVRDIVLGQIPKDIDIFVPYPDWVEADDMEYFLATAERIFRVLGLEVDEREFRARGGRYGAVGENQAGKFVAVKSLGGLPPGNQPVDIIFAEGFTGTNHQRFVLNNFDLDICKAWVTPHGIIRSEVAQAAAAEGTVWITRPGNAYNLIDRVAHLKEKYPQLAVRVDSLLVGYDRLLGILNHAQRKGVLDAAGEILQAEGQGVAGDGLRQQDGAVVPPNLRDMLQAWLQRG